MLLKNFSVLKMAVRDYSCGFATGKNFCQLRATERKRCCCLGLRIAFRMTCVSLFYSHPVGRHRPHRTVPTAATQFRLH